MPQKERTLDTHAKYYDISMKMQMLGKNDCFRKMEVEHSHVKKGDKVLDFGCGTGMLTTYLADVIGKNGYIVGVDVGAEMLRIAKQKFSGKKNAKFVLINNSEKLPFKSDYFDVVTTSLVMHLLTEEQKKAAFREMYRVLKKKGRFLCVDFGKPTNLLGWIVKLYITKLCILIWAYEKNAVPNFEGKILNMVKEAGFKNAKITRRQVGFVEYTEAVK